jgi:hypothetical protein
VFGIKDWKEIESGSKTGKLHFTAGTEILIRTVPL